MKKIYLVLFFSLFALAAYSQSSPSFDVMDFKYDPNDLTARTSGTKVMDQNGELCALIKIETTETGTWFFDVGMLGVRQWEHQNEAHPAEIWVYVPHGVTWITIQHNVFGKVNHYKFPCSIEKGCTYVMKLITGHVEPVIIYTLTQQYLVFNVTPKDATVTVDGEIWPVDSDGRAENQVPIGKKYSYSIEAKDYHTEVGMVEVSDAAKKVEKNIELKPAFGFLIIKGDNGILSEATVRIDKANGTDAISRAVKLSSGQHEVVIAHPKYKTFTRTVTISDGETYELQVALGANFSTVTLKVDDNAEIWVGNEKKGVRSWTGDLVAGEYLIECRKPNHRTSQVKKTITDNMSGEVITLSPPTPINGMLNITSKPSGAKILIDNVEMGETPLQIPAILIGEHTLRLEKKGCAPLAKTIVVEENKILTLDEKLDTGRSMMVKTDRKGDKIYVDGSYIGETPYETPLGFGHHTIRVIRNGVKVEKEVDIYESTKNGQELVFEFGRMITIDTDQKGDLVMVDGENVGISPVSVDLPYGHHTIHAERGKKYADKDIEVNKTGGETSHFLRLHGETASHFVKNGVNFVTLDAAHDLNSLLSYGLTAGSVKKLGWFVTASSNFNFDALDYNKTTDANGLVDGYYPNYNGVTYSTRFSLMGGMVVLMGGPAYFRFGAGYGARYVCKETLSGDRVRVSSDSFAGIDATAGLQFNLKGFTMSLDAVTSGFQSVEVKLGLGYCWKRKAHQR